jgi:hypothetical protein
MEPKIYLSLLLVGLIIGFSYFNEASAFIRKRQFAKLHKAGTKAAAHSS